MHCADNSGCAEGGLIAPCNPDIRCQQHCHHQREQRGGLKFSCAIGRIWHLVLVSLWLGHLTFPNNLKQVHWETIPCQELMMSRLITVLGSDPPDPSGKDLKIWLQLNNKVCHVDGGFLWIPLQAVPKQSVLLWFSVQKKASGYQILLVWSSKNWWAWNKPQHLALEQEMRIGINLYLGNFSLLHWNNANRLSSSLKRMGFSMSPSITWMLAVPFGCLCSCYNGPQKEGAEPCWEMREIAGILLAHKRNCRMTFSWLLHSNPDTPLRVMPLEWCPKWWL